MLNTDKFWVKIKYISSLFMLLPIILVLVGIFLQNKGFTGIIKSYDVGMARIVQYILFGIGVIIFFFCDNISEFFSNKLFVKDDDSRLEENMSSYFAYIFIIMWLLNLISIFGFIGYLMCSNITWLILFAALNFFLQIRFRPSEKKFKKLISSVDNI